MDTLNVKNYGARGDGRADDAPSIQATLDAVGDGSAGVYFPQGVYRVTQTLTYRGNSSYGIRVYGDLGRTRGPGGTQILWDGVPGGTVLHLLGANNSAFERLEIVQGAAKYGVHAEFGHIRRVGSSGLLFRDLTFAGARGDGVCLALGDESPGHHQCSEVTVEDCYFGGDGADPGTGFKTLTGSNTKNFRLSHCDFSTLKVGVDWYLSSGYLTALGCMFGNIVQACFRKSVSCLTVLGGGCESAYPCRLLDAPHGGANFSSSSICHFYFNVAAPADAVVIETYGFLRLTGCHFDYFTGRVPRIICNPQPPGGLVSEGNHFGGDVLKHAPFYDGSGNWITGPESHWSDKRTNISSFADYCGPAGQLAALPHYHGGGW